MGVIDNKETLDDKDILFLKENLPEAMFDSFLLDKVSYNRAGKSKKILEENSGFLNVDEKEFLARYQASSSNNNHNSSGLDNTITSEFKALRKEVDRQTSSPVGLFLISDRTQHYGCRKTQSWKDFFCQDASQLRRFLFYS